MTREERIVAESERTVKAVEGGGPADDWCDACDAPTPMLTLEMAASVACVGNGAIRYWMDNSEFHYHQTQTGHFRVCSRSFLDHLKRLNFMPRQRSRGNSPNLADAEDHAGSNNPDAQFSLFEGG